MIGQTIANYKILKELGTGGMGTVYLAENVSIGSRVAIKMLHPHLVKSENIKTRFLKEAKTQANLNHPNITKVIDFVSNEQGLFIILEFVEGEPLNDFLFKSKGLLPEKEANHYMAKILDAVGYAHSKGIVHRDLKSANIMVTPNKDIKIMDFGIAKMANETLSLTKTGSRLGSPLYMSPEQVTNGQVDFRSDIYSLGVVYHEMLTGTPVYDQNTTTEFEIYNKIVKQPLPRLKEFYKMNSDRAQEIVDTAAAKLPTARFQSCWEFKTEILNGVPKQKAIPAVRSENVKFRNNPVKKDPKNRNNKNYISVVIILLLLIALLGGGAYYLNHSGGEDNGLQNELQRKAADFTASGNYKEAFSIYSNLYREHPKDIHLADKMEQLKAKSQAFQQRSADSLLNIYLQTSSLDNFDVKDSILGYKLLQGFDPIQNQMDQLKEHPKVVGDATTLTQIKTRLQNIRKLLEGPMLNEAGIIGLNSEGKKEADDNIVAVVFNRVDNPPIFPGCSESNPVAQKECFELKINEYLRSKLPLKLYKDQGWAQGRQICNYSFVIGKDGRLKDVFATNPKSSQIAVDAQQALANLRGIKPGFHGQVPVNVSYKGSLVLDFPKREKREIANEHKEQREPKEEEPIYRPLPDHISMEMADTAPVFPGCEGQSGMALVRCTSNKINDYIKVYIDYDKLSRVGLPKGNQRIFLKFRITDRGDVRNIVVRAPIELLEQEVSRVIRTLPQMGPGIYNGTVAPIDYNVGLVISIK